MENNTMIPKYIEKLPFNLRYGWLSAFNTAYDLYGIDRAVAVANAWVLKKINELENANTVQEDYSDEVKEKVMELSEPIATSKDGLVSVELKPVNNELISCSEDGEIVEGKESVKRQPVML